MDRVSLPDMLTFSGGNYVLTAVVHHYGDGTDTGHFVTSFRVEGDRWGCADDDNVGWTDEHKVKSQSDSCYLVFYVKECDTTNPPNPTIVQARRYNIADFRALILAMCVFIAVTQKSFSK